jgi:hypothetical protein
MASRDGAEGVYLLWIPLGAGASVPVVHWCGRVYESASARFERRQRQDLFHAALEIESRGERFVVEMTPAWGSAHTSAGSVASGPVAFKLLGRSRFFRYEVHCARNGVIPHREHAVGEPECLSNDPDAAGRILALAPRCPTARWGRDDFGAGDMWNSTRSWPGFWQEREFPQLTSIRRATEEHRVGSRVSSRPVSGLGNEARTPAGCRW